MHPRAFAQTVRDLVEPTIQRLGFDLVAVELLGGARRAILRLSVHGVGADDCALISHRISPLLDDAELITGSYDLEVSSPGIDRPVQRLTDFQRFAGFRIRLRLEEGLPRRRYAGTLVQVEGDDVVVEVDGEQHRILFDTIERAQLVLDLDEYSRLADGLPPIPGAEGHPEQGEGVTN
jgi:ribosome maturation factor RimP